MSYTRNPFWQWENEVSSATVGIILTVIVVGAAILLTLLLILLKELWRIYQTRALNQPHSTTARTLWTALILFLGILLLSVFLGVAAGAGTIAGYLAAWSFLLFVIVVEAADHFSPPAIDAPGDEGLVLGEPAA